MEGTMCQYSITWPSPESTATVRPLSSEATPERTGYTGARSGVEMSIPKWNWKMPAALASVWGVLGPLNDVRGSPRFARIGCSWSNGLTGQRDPVACAGAGRGIDTQKTAARPATMVARAVRRNVLPRLVCALSVDIAQRSGRVQTAQSRRTNDRLISSGRL